MPTHPAQSPLYKAWNLATWRLMEAIREDDGSCDAMTAIAAARAEETRAQRAYKEYADSCLSVDVHGLTAADRTAIRLAHDERVAEVAV